MYLGFWSIFSQILHMMWGNGPVSFFCICVSSSPITIYWKDYSYLIKLSGIPVENQWLINVSVCFWNLSSTPLFHVSTLMLVQYHLITVVLKSVWNWKVWVPPTFSFQHCFSCSGLEFPREFRKSLSILAKQKAAKIFIGVVLESIDQYCNHNNIKSFNSWTWDVLPFI